MGKGRRYNKKKCRIRKKKSGVERKRRDKVHAKRLMALGVSADKIRHMTSKDLRDELKKLTQG